MYTLTNPFLRLTAQDLMSRDVLLLPQELSVRAAARWLTQDHVSGAPVVDATGRCVGVLSATDFLRHTGHEVEPTSTCCNLTTTVFHGWQMVDMEVLPADQVRNYMTPDPVMVPPTTPIVELARTMLVAHIHRVIVVDNVGHPIGVVTATDILAAVAHTERRDLQDLDTVWPAGD